MKKSPELDPLAERPNLDFSKAVRGKYSNLLEKGTNLAIIDPVLHEHFPDSESVNRALRALLSTRVNQDSQPCHADASIPYRIKVIPQSSNRQHLAPIASPTGDVDQPRGFAKSVTAE